MTKKLNQRQEKALERRKEILLAAKKLFALHGYHATTTRSINKEMGMADGLLYHYFPKGKKQILETIVEEEAYNKMSNIFGSLEKISVEDGLEHVLKSVGRIILDHGTRDLELITILLSEKNLLSNSVIKSWPKEIHSLFEKIEEILQHFIKSGEIKPLNARFMVLQFIGPFNLYLVQKVLLGSEASLPEETSYLELVVDQTLQAWRI